MAEATVTLAVPSTLARELDLANEALLVDLLQRGLRELKIEQALARYVQGNVSFGAAAHESGVSQSELARHAYARGMEPPATEQTLAEELQ